MVVMGLVHYRQVIGLYRPHRNSTTGTRYLYKGTATTCHNVLEMLVPWRPLWTGFLILPTLLDVYAVGHVLSVLYGISPSPKTYPRTINLYFKVASRSLGWAPPPSQKILRFHNVYTLRLICASENHSLVWQVAISPPPPPTHFFLTT